MPARNPSSEDFLEIIETLLGMVARKEQEVQRLLGTTVVQDLAFDLDRVRARQLTPQEILILMRQDNTSEILQLLFRRAGFRRVHEAHSLAEALALSDQYAPGVMLVELEANGQHDPDCSVVRRLRERAPQSAIIAVLQDQDAATFGEAAWAGADEIVTQPIDTVRLLQVVLGLSDTPDGFSG